MIAIVDYGMGNLHSVKKAFDFIGAQSEIVTEPAAIDAAEKIVLPGVGAFADAIDTLQKKQLVNPLKQAIEDGRYFLGICLGLQMLFDISYEDGQFPGIGVIPGEVVHFDFSNLPDQANLKIPHMGWNALDIKGDIPIYRSIENGSYVYFVHSYYVVPTDNAVIATTTTHGCEFVSSIARGNLFATQFHPEKSQRIGLQILKNFTNL